MRSERGGRAHSWTRGKLALTLATLVVVGPSPALAVPEPYRGWVKSTLLEQFGVTAIESYDSVTYTQESSSPHALGNGAPAGGYCYHSLFPFWYLQECSILNFTSTPDRVQIYGYGEWCYAPPGSVGCARFWLDDTWETTRTDYLYSCGVSEVPPFWEHVCAGGNGVELADP